MRPRHHTAAGTVIRITATPTAERLLTFGGGLLVAVALGLASWGAILGIVAVLLRLTGD
jgi:hypothetical protein